jgi:hypothetical protein
MATVGWVERALLLGRAQPVRRFANMSAPRDSSSDDDNIAAIVNLNNEFFYTHFFDESDTDSNNDADLMVAVATVLNEANEAYMPQWRGSVKGRAANLDRNRENGHVQLYADYLHPETALYRNYFRHRFQMTRKLFGRIIEGVRLHDPYFRCKTDATGKLGFSLYQKCSTAGKMWSEHMVFFRLVGPLFVTQLRHGVFSKCERS